MSEFLREVQSKGCAKEGESNPPFSAGKVRPNGRVGSLSEAPSSLAAASGLGLACCPPVWCMNDEQLPGGEAAGIRQQAPIEQVLQTKSFLGALGMDRQVNEGQIDLTFNELVTGEEIRLWERYLALQGDKGPSTL